MPARTSPYLEELLLQTLSEGSVASKAGNATALLVDCAGLHTIPNQRYAAALVRAGLRSLEERGLVTREVRGGRTYRIARKEATS